MRKKKVLIIIGPTASGKSELAVRLAKKFGGEIISADSRQVYRGLNIGTGKITKKEMRGIPHYLLDVTDPRKQFSAAEFKTLATNSLRYIVANSKLPIVVGGTGFYIDTLAERISLPDVPPNKTLRKKLGKMTAEKLFEILKKKDLQRAKSIDRQNKVRLIRAIEIVEALGKVPEQANSSQLKDYSFIYIGLKPDKKELEKKIRLRLTEWIENGLVNEVKKLHTQGISWRRFDQIGLVYHSVARYLRGKISREEMAEEIFKEIKQYAKRQMVWFKRNQKIKWFALNPVEGFKPEEYKRIERYVRMTLLGL